MTASQRKRVEVVSTIQPSVYDIGLVDSKLRHSNTLGQVVHASIKTAPALPPPVNDSYSTSLGTIDPIRKRIG